MKEFCLLCRLAAAALLVMAAAVFGVSEELYRGLLGTTVDTTKVAQGEFALFLLICSAIAFGASFLTKLWPNARPSF